MAGRNRDEYRHIGPSAGVDGAADAGSVGAWFQWAFGTSRRPFPISDGAGFSGAWSVSPWFADG